MTSAEVKDCERYKTTMCKNWTKSGHCPYGSRCQFAHGDADLRVRVCKPSRPPNFWMRSKNKQAPTQDRARPPALAPGPLGLDAPAPLSLEVTAPRVTFDLPSPPPSYAMLGALAAAPSPLARSRDLGTYGATLLDFGPIDATATTAAQVCGECLRVNQTTGKVEACAGGGGESTGCTAPTSATEEEEAPPLLDKRQTSHTTSLVRRACSFLFDEGQAPSLRRRTTLESLESKGRSTAEEKECSSTADELAIRHKLGSLLDQFDASATPLPPPPAVLRRLSLPKLPTLNKSLPPSWGVAGRPMVA